LADQNLREKESQSVFLSQAFPIPPQDPRKFLFPKQQRFFLAIEHRSDPQEPQSFFLVRGFIIEWKILSGIMSKDFPTIGFCTRFRNAGLGQSFLMRAH
jgi:hypothetical protein